MLASLRRCPASVRWSIISRANASAAATFPISRTQIGISQSFKAACAPPRSTQRFLHHTSFLRQQEPAAPEQAQAQAQAEAQDDTGEMPQGGEEMGELREFQELADRGLVSAKVVANITDRMNIKTMTAVQSLTINEAITGRDVLAQAKTGTGKTLAFLLPILRNILAEDPALESRDGPSRSSYADRSRDIRAIVISPTRELAEQIAVEAEKLTQGTGVIVQRAVGGTQKSLHTRKLKKEGCHILVGTPGRLHDLLTDTESDVQAPKLSAFVLDEADRLMDEGFAPEIQRIQQALPARAERDRQTLMFSATMPREILKLVRETMKRNLHLVRTVREDEQPTHERVPQNLVAVTGLENQLPALLELCERQIAASKAKDAPPFKAIVYFQSTAEVVLAASILFRLRRAALAGEPSGIDATTRVLEIHGKLSQASRTKASDTFRRSKHAILLSTDVTARGLDFPGVSHVIQVGLPKDRDTYVHRLGRTARAGAEGEGWLIIPSTALNQARRQLGPLPIHRDRSLETANVRFPELTGDPQADVEPEMSDATALFFSQIKSAAKAVPREQREDVYLAGLGTFGFLADRSRVVDMLNRLASVQWGMAPPPAVSPTLARRLRLLGIPGLNLRASRDGDGDFDDRDRERGGSRGPRRSNDRFGPSSRSEQRPDRFSRSSFDRDSRSNMRRAAPARTSRRASFA